MREGLSIVVAIVVGVVDVVGVVPIVPIPNGVKNEVWPIPLSISKISKPHCERIVSIPPVPYYPYPWWWWVMEDWELEPL